MYKKKTYYEDDEIKLSLEQEQGELFVHLVLYKASKAILDKVLRVWAEIKAKAYYDGYEAIYTYTKDDRMAKLFPGNEYLGNINYNGEQFKVLKWELN